jgi:hypothetical protein
MGFRLSVTLSINSSPSLFLFFFFFFFFNYYYLNISMVVSLSVRSKGWCILHTITTMSPTLSHDPFYNLRFVCFVVKHFL